VKEVVMIEISVSRELAAEHPGFLAGCAERGHRVEVFGTSREQPESGAARTRGPDDMPDAYCIGQRSPGA
jgi:hypothetical protein